MPLDADVFIETTMQEADAGSSLRLYWEVCRDANFGAGSVTAGCTWFSAQKKCYRTKVYGGSLAQSMTNYSEERCDNPPPPVLIVECPDCESDCMESPIIVDLDTGQYRLSSLEDGVMFDIDGDGYAERVSWVSGTTQRLALDRDLNGSIDGGHELFGSATLLASGERAANGFVALREFDANLDSWINDQDPIWTQLALWHDTNRNGLSDLGELTPVAETALTAISLDYNTVGRRDRWGNLLRYFSTANTSRGTQPIYDVFFSVATP